MTSGLPENTGPLISPLGPCQVQGVHSQCAAQTPRAGAAGSLGIPDWVVPAKALHPVCASLARARRPQSSLETTWPCSSRPALQPSLLTPAEAALPPPRPHCHPCPSTVPRARPHCRCRACSELLPQRWPGKVSKRKPGLAAPLPGTTGSWPASCLARRPCAAATAGKCCSGSPTTQFLCQPQRLPCPPLPAAQGRPGPCPPALLPFSAHHEAVCNAALARHF